MQIKFLLLQLASSIGKIRSLDSGVNRELDDLKELYRREALQRKLLYNKVNKKL